MSACSILLVSANRHTSPYPVYPLGLSYLKTYLERTISGIRVDMADCNLLTDGQLAERIRMLAPRYIGLSLRNVDGANSLDRRGFLPQYRALADVIRAASDAPLIIGGAGFSIYPEAFMRELGADYGYMFEQVKGYGTDNKDDLAVKALDNTTLEVTLSNSVAYWNELLAFPTFFPVREDVVANEGWATDPSTYVCNGAYTIASWDHNSVITTVKNPNYYDAANVTMEQVKYYLSDNANNDLANFKNGDWQMIDDVPTNEIATLKADYPDEFFVVGQIGTYYVIWNMNEEILPS